MQLSPDGLKLMKVTPMDIKNGIFTIPNSVKHIDNSAFAYCNHLSQVIIPNSVTHIGDHCFLNCNKLNVIIIDAPNKQEYQRIKDLVPREYQHLIMSFEFYQEINHAKQQAYISIKPIGMDSFPKKLPEEIIHLIQIMAGWFHDIINQFPLPRRPEDLDEYKHALQDAWSQLRQEQEPLHLKLTAINKLQNVMQITEKAIDRAAKKSGFFDYLQNKSKLDESQARIIVIRKLIDWLGDDETITFTKDEKNLLSKDESSIALILKNNGIDIKKLPNAPASRCDSCNIM